MREMQEGRRGHEWQASGTFRHLFPPAFSSMPTTSVRKRGLGCLPSQVNSRVVSLPKPLWLLHLRSPPGYLASWSLLCFRLLSPSHLQVTCLPFPLILGAQSFPLPQSPPVFPVHWPLMLPACLLLSPAWHLSSPCRRSQCRLEGAGWSQFFTAPDRGLSPQGAPTHLSLTNTGGRCRLGPHPTHTCRRLLSSPCRLTRGLILGHFGSCGVDTPPLLQGGLPTLPSSTCTASLH